MIFWIKLRKNLKRLLSYLKTAPSNLSNVIYHVKQKMPYLGTLRPEFERKTLPYLKSAPSNLSKCKVSD